jgi:two-component system NtrC family response regulator
MSQILIIDDEPQMCDLLVRLAEQNGHQAEFAQSLGDGLTLARERDVDLVFLDIYMPDGNGLEFLQRIQSVPSSPEVIIMTGMTSADGAELAIRSGAWDYVEKGSPISVFNLAMLRALDHHNEKRSQSASALLKLDGLVGSTHVFRRCLEDLKRAADCDANALVVSETGTGKELFARAVHDNSLRAEKSFVVVDCAALPEQLVESALFGHRHGAFTGASKTRDGMVKQADGGTLFLDEVGELPLPIQKAFLRVLQERRFRPIGSATEESSDFRLIAATNRNLSLMVEGGEFREDLLYRLRGLTISLPSLRERVDDIEAIARFHTHRICRQRGDKIKTLSHDFVATLCRYSWPGNVRELVNALEHAISAAGTRPELFPQHLPTELRAQLARTRFESTPAAQLPPGSKRIPPADPNVPLSTLTAFRESAVVASECAYLRSLVSRHGKNIGEACRVSGLSRSRLYALLKKHHVARPS